MSIKYALKFTALAAAIAVGSSLPAFAPAAAQETPEAARPDAELGFFKLVVSDSDAAQKFYETAFGFEMVTHYEFPTIDERVMVLPGSNTGMVLFHRQGQGEIEVGTAHGPVGIRTSDVDALYAQAMAAGATSKTAPYNLGETGTRLAFVFDPDGHEIEIIRLGR